MWIYNPTPAKLDTKEKKLIIVQTDTFIKSLNKLKDKVYKTKIVAGRLYLSDLMKVEICEGIMYTKPIINDSYIETPLARITIYNAEVTSCSLEYQRHNNSWITIYTGTLESCLKYLNENIEIF